MLVKDSVHSFSIIGGGLAGLGLVLALQAHSVACAIYELRGPSYELPRSTRVVARFTEHLGQASSLRTGRPPTLWPWATSDCMGYKALRIYRRVLVGELHRTAIDRGISLEFDKKYSHIVSEDETGVEFAFADGSTEKAGVLLGADGIYSKVRSHIAPERTSLRIPPDEDVSSPVSWIGLHGAFVLAPQDVDGGEFLAGKQIAYPEQGRAGWKDFLNDKDKLLGSVRKGKDDGPDLVQSALENIDPSTFIIWPLYTVPPLQRWISAEGRVFISGDAAHAIPPPTAGPRRQPSLRGRLQPRDAPGATVSANPPCPTQRGFRQTMRHRRELPRWSN